jgi:gluconate 2-dehydrogenase gamma chain
MTPASTFSRRELFRKAAQAGVAVVALPELSRVLGVQRELYAQAGARALTAPEFATLSAICGRIIPNDANGPGAVEAHAPEYIDHALTGALSTTREAYADGLKQIDQVAMAKFAAPFVKLTAAQQDQVLTEQQDSQFFALVRGHTMQGTFCDPLYGGNANFIGWDLIGYPGVRLNVTAAEQNMSTPAARNHKSAYDYLMFSKTATMSGH